MTDIWFARVALAWFLIVGSLATATLAFLSVGLLIDGAAGAGLVAARVVLGVLIATCAIIVTGLFGVAVRALWKDGRL